ncbi:AAA family ATPase [Parvimonas micra]|uniref:AAA family ATPase n=1 Tax=Parvimonas micra TaxID=33033 RepID=UPI002B46F475|nr:AAA family ATPase [Parvimonas micra]MEB3060632.1 AAA family ATPase [Parvimonas micra]MEB3066489.1 AAA family ATPase [Parvimonas micra]
MKLFLKNIGKIEEATIDLNGITVIAGENDTGKSTIGKALFAVFNSFYDIESKIKMEREKSIENYIFANSNSNSINLSILRENFIDTVINELNSDNIHNIDEKTIKKTIYNNIEENVDDETIELVDKTAKKVKEVFGISHLEFLKEILKNNLLTEFSYQIGNIFSNEDSEITLTIKGRDINIKIKDDKFFSVENDISLGTEVIYIDNPFIIDDIDTIILSRLNRNISSKHSYFLRKKLESEYFLNTIIDKIIIQKSFEEIFNKIDLGNFVKFGPVIKYKKNNNEKALNVENLSTGIKSFMLIKTLLLNGHLSENGTIVLDEPEVHLHPEWQLIFAELIVLLQKEFNMHILLTTHSPYFLNAIEVYSAKYEIKEKCKFYLSENDGNFAKFNDVTNNSELIYKKLARPFQELENEGSRYE